MEIYVDQTTFNLGTVRLEPETRTAFCKSRCDRYDYLAATGCGVLSGLVDIFLVGMPNVGTSKANSILGSWTDEQADKAVMAFAKLLGWKGSGIGSAIGYLEGGQKDKFKGFPVNYDQATGADVDKMFKMSLKNHHDKSLAHSPDLIGLFFSLLSQFTGKSAFLDNGTLYFYPVDAQIPQGKTLLEKLFYGTATWFGHLMSDFAGSSGGRGQTNGRGSGIVIPFYELFGLCKFGSFRVKGEGKRVYNNTVAQIATRVFEKGYDARWGLTMSIPVLLCDLNIKLIWAIRHYFCDGWPLTACIPTRKHDDLRVMLIVGDATLCLVDGADAALRSNGKIVNFCLRLNLIAWYRLVKLVLREACIRLGMGDTVETQLEAYRVVNEVLDQKMAQLKTLDLERWKQETAQYDHLICAMEGARTEQELTILLKQELERLGIERPYEGEFDDFMQDENAVLRFH